jgi:4a-hydroxytetrahydrobiopterin dehydratase
MARPKALESDEITRRLEALEEWTLEDGKLHRNFVFADFVAAMGFMTQSALHAERLDHHPEWSNVYNRVTVDLTTHDADGITELDFALAERMDELAR